MRSGEKRKGLMYEDASEADLSGHEFFADIFESYYESKQLGKESNLKDMDPEVFEFIKEFDQMWLNIK